MKKTIIIALTVFTIMNQKAFSCSCKNFTLDSLQKISYEVSDIVFLGELISYDTINYTYEFLVYDTFKGNDSSRIITGKYFDSCSMFPREKSLWIVYAQFESENLINISQCLGTRSFSNPLRMTYPIPPPPPVDNSESYEYSEIELLKYELENEKVKRQALSDMIIELEKLRYKKKFVNL